jgi:hypothetical protein
VEKSRTALPVIHKIDITKIDNKKHQKIDSKVSGKGTNI